MADEDLTPTDLLELLDYTPETGSLVWRARSAGMFLSGKQSAAHNAAIWNGKFAGKPLEVSGRYARASIFGRRYYAHRIAWAMFYGAWPEREIDHINGNKHDNRIANLREVTTQENSRNIPVKSNNSSGALGVRWRAHANAWEAYICIDRKYRHIGYFKAKADAIAARKATERTHGFHANHGRAA